MSERHKGFVVASDQNLEGHLVWKVKVKDAQSPFNGKKIVVASVHDGLALARGLNVEFAIGTVDDTYGQKVVRAVDVRLENPGVNLEVHSHPVKRRSYDR